MDIRDNYSSTYKSRLNLNIKKKDNTKPPQTKTSEQPHLTINSIPTTTPILQQPYKEIKKQKSMLENFKQTYDLLQKNYQSKRRQCDQLQNQTKKLQVLLLNSNPQYYEKQIRRLHQIIQKLQQENQDNKHKYFVSQNQRKQLQATVKVKSDEIKTLLKQLQKEKISVVELKHQVTQKQKYFQRVTLELQNSNNSISSTYQETNSKLTKLQGLYKSKINQLNEVQRNYEQSVKSCNEFQWQAKNNKEIYDRNISCKSKQLEQLHDLLRETVKKYKENIRKLEQEVEQMKKHKKTQQLLTTQKVQTALLFKNNRNVEIQKNKLEQSNKELVSQLEQKKIYIKKIEQQLKQSCPKEQLQTIQQKLKQKQKQIALINKKYQSRINELEKLNQRIKLQQYTNNHLDSKYTKDDFQTLLRNQIQEAAKIKNELSVKIDQVFNVKSQLQQQKVKVKMLQSQIDILKRKLKSQQKTHKIQNDLSSQNLKNDVQSLKRKLEMTETKLSIKIKQLKEKQNFIMNTIIGRSKQQDVPLIMAQFQRIFQADYINKLYEAHRQIKQLTKS